MPLANFLDRDNPNRVVVQGKVDQRQTVYHLQTTIVGEWNLYEIVRDMKAQGCEMRVTFEVMDRSSQLGS
jgi:DUF1009 family protein